MFETSFQENDENRLTLPENVVNSQQSLPQSSENIFHQILKNNLFKNRPKSLILTDNIESPRNVWGPEKYQNSLTTIDETFHSERKISSTPFKVLDAPNLQDDFYLNVVDWSSNHNLAVGLGQALYIWNYHTNQVKKLTEFYGRNLLTSVSWDPRSNVLGIGSKEGSVSLWDGVKEVNLKKYYEHTERVGALSIFGSLLLTGSKDRNIILSDIRLKNSVVKKFTSHKQEICGLKWSPDGNYFASGGNDNKLCVFSPKTTYPLMKKSHKAAVKAIAWSPRRVGLLASGAGTADRCIRLWNINSKQLLRTKETGSQVCNLAFSKQNDELISSHGFSNNEICIWNSTDFRKIKTLKGHLSRVLYLAMSPCGNYIVSGAGDETLRFWNLNYEIEETQEEFKSSLGITSKKCKRKSKKFRISKLEQKLIR
jgi:cell division cycle 20-like protein 1 (cofactor of APC complex)